MAALSYSYVIDETERTEEDVTKEKREAYLAAVVREREGYKQRLAQEEASGRGETEKIKDLRASIEACNAELGEAGEQRRTRNPVAK